MTPARIPLALAAALAVAAVVPARAQDASGLSRVDRSFLHKEAQGSIYELTIAQLAQQRATRPEVKNYAARIVSDHESYNEALQQLAQSKGVTLPKTMDRADAERLTQLKRQQGAAFDRAYVQESTRINADDKRSFAREAKATHDEQVRDFVSRFSDMDAEHERMGEALRGG